MNKHLHDILGELYALDPELRAHEKELMPILEKLMKFKPNATPDEAFVQKLRIMLRDKASEPESQHLKAKSSFLSFFSMYKLNYAVTGAILGAVITGPIVYSVLQSGSTQLPTNDGSTSLFSYSVEETKNEAFGDLAMADTQMYGRGGGGSSPEIDTSARPQSGGGGGDAGNYPVPSMIQSDSKMMGPAEMTEYNLVFEGNMPTLTNTEVDVYQRQTGGSSADAHAILKNLNTGLLNLGSFGGMKSESVSFYQDTEYGYQTYINFRDGSISINANWDKWPHPESACTTEECYQRYMPKIGDVPADDVLVNIAADFVKDHGFDLSNYGAPEVDKQWRVSYDSMQDKRYAYVPESIRVVFPLLLDGKVVYDEGGAKSGLSVGVNIRHDRVSDAYGIMDQKYLKSAYAAVTDTAQITQYLDKYGEYPAEWSALNTTVKKVDVKIGTPEIGLMRSYQYENGKTSELVIPALIFPVTESPAGSYFYRSSITVPLAKEMLDKLMKGPEGRPMPAEPIIMEDTVRDVPQE